MAKPRPALPWAWCALWWVVSACSAQDPSAIAGTTIEVADGPRVVDTSLDQRPELVLHLPELPAVPERYRSADEAAAETSPADRWIVWASRRTAPPFRPVGALAVTTFGGGGAWESPIDVEALEEPGEKTTRALRFSGSGHWLVYVAAERRSIPHLYFVEVELAAGETRELAMPPLDASLEGAFERDLVANHHGVAGPRMMLIRAAGANAGWNVVNYLPDEVYFGQIDTRHMELVPPADMPEHHDFALRDLPAGEYHLFHHLGEDAVWGGIEVFLRTGGIARVPRLGSDQPGRWTVAVVDSVGHPVRGRVLRVRDRMHEAWAAYSQTNTGGYPADPIPLPPAAPLHGEPVTFESIRAGWVELVLDDPAGPARHYLRKAEPGSRLTLVVGD